MKSSAPVSSHARLSHLEDVPQPADSRAFLPEKALILLGVFAVMAFAYLAWPVVLPFMLAWVAAMTLKPPVSWLRARHFPTSLAAAIVLGFFLAAVSLATIELGRPAVAWAKSAPEQIPHLKQKFKNILQPIMRFSAVASNVGSLDPVQTSTNTPPLMAVKEDDHLMGTMFTWTRSLLVGIAEAIVLTFLLLASGDTFMQKLAHVLPDRRHKKQAVEISREVQHSISSYLFTVSLINFGFGCAAGIGFWLVGMPNPIMWGGAAGMLNFLPFFGPTMGIILVGLAGLLAFDTFSGALLPVMVYFLLHLIESYLITPFALGQRFSLNRVVVFVAFIYFIWLWGVFGALLAVPLLVSLKVVCERVPPLLPLAEFLSP
jgi:predicted PurR-regulated permease PerM